MSCLGSALVGVVTTFKKRVGCRDLLFSGLLVLKTLTSAIDLVHLLTSAALVAASKAATARRELPALPGCALLLFCGLAVYVALDYIVIKVSNHERRNHI